MMTKNLLIELGTEELPPKSLRVLAESLFNEFTKNLASNKITYTEAKWYATPRRLAVYVKDVPVKLEDSVAEIKGPSTKIAYDANGQFTNVALAWAKSNQADLNKIETLKTDKGEWLVYRVLQTGKQTSSMFAELFNAALKRLPIPKLMKWGDKKELFVRPVHTFCMLFGEDLIDATSLGIKSSRTINGHRFLGTPNIVLKSADSYVQQLFEEGFVIVDYDKRKQIIRDKLIQIGESVKGLPDLDDDLIEEVTSIIEAPYVFKATFDKKFLKVPSEALVYTMKGDQKYFPIYDQSHNLLPVFAFVSNINPENPTQLISGNERVITPRLSDAEFFFQQDRSHKLEEFFGRLEHIVYQKDLGTIAERARFVSSICELLAPYTGADLEKCRRAAYLAKCDLASTMVSEFTDTQGVMGMHYANLDHEDPEVAQAIFDQYLPRFSGDIIPTTAVGVTLSLAEKLATLVGIFGVNLLPKGDKDPFGLRRAAIGLVRIILAANLKFNLREIVEASSKIISEKTKNPNVVDQVCDFVFNRLKYFYLEHKIPAAVYGAVAYKEPSNLADFDKKLHALNDFIAQPDVVSLTSAFKRISNILAKANMSEVVDFDFGCLSCKEEVDLLSQLNNIEPKLEELYSTCSYSEYLKILSMLKDDLDNFFDKVMVNVEDTALRKARLALINRIHSMFMRIADISLVN